MFTIPSSPGEERRLHKRVEERLRSLEGIPHVSSLNPIERAALKILKQQFEGSGVMGLPTVVGILRRAVRTLKRVSK